MRELLKRNKSTATVLLFIIITLSVVSVCTIFLPSSENKLIEYVGIFISAILGVSSLFFVVTQYDRSRKIEEGQFIAGLNSEFINNDDLKEVYRKLYLESKNSSQSEIEESDITKVVSYLTFLETFWTMYNRGIIDLEMINDLFANRFFLMVTNSNVQRLKLVTEHNLYSNIRRLEKEWREYRQSRNLLDLYASKSLNREIAVKVASDLYRGNSKDGEDLLFRTLQEHDIDAICHLQKKAIKLLANKEHLYETSREDFRKIIIDNTNLSCGCFMDEKLVAYSFFTFPEKTFAVFKSLFWFPRWRSKSMYFKVVVVDRQYRNKGLQQAFLEGAYEYAEFYKIKRIIATVHRDNKVSNIVFNKSGFKKKAQKKLHNNSWRNVYVLTLQ